MGPESVLLFALIALGAGIASLTMVSGFALAAGLILTVVLYLYGRLFSGGRRILKWIHYMDSEGPEAAHIVKADRIIFAERGPHRRERLRVQLQKKWGERGKTEPDLRRNRQIPYTQRLP